MNNMERINRREMVAINISLSVTITFILFNCHRSTDNSIDFYLYFCCEKDHDNKEFSSEN